MKTRDLIRAFISLIFFCGSIGVSAQTTLSAKVFAKPGSGKYYGKLYIPKGTKWRIAHNPVPGTEIEVYSGHIDGTNIYLRPTDLQDGGFWIDAEETDHIFIVRSTSSADVVAEKVTAAEDEAYLVYNYYYDKSDKKRNKFKFTSTAVANNELKTSSTYNTKGIYVMANPSKYGLAFLKLDPNVTSADLAKNSLFVLTRMSSSSRLNVIFGDDQTDTSDDNITTIHSIDNESLNDDVIYTLQGLRVESPQKGGLYICNGRIFIAK
jgi:hypothetical protein